MHFLRFAGALLLASSAVGCGPYLTSRAVPTSHAYASPVRCGQGPYEFHATAIGHKWGESVALYQAGGKPVSGHVEITIDGKKVASEDVGSGTTNNQACVLGPQDGIATAGGGATGGGGGGVPGGYTPNVPPVTTSGGPPPTLIEVNGGGTAQWDNLLRWRLQVDDWAKSDLVLKAGVDIKIVFWSKDVLDLENVKFVIGQAIFEPSCGDEKWVIHLNEQKADREKKEREAKEEREAEEKARVAEDTRCRGLALKNQLDAKCKKAGWHDVNEAEEDARCNALALKNAIDDKCRLIGWHNDNERPGGGGGGSSGGQPITSWSSGGGGSSHTGGNVSAPPPPQEPKGPPPPPQIEVKTPQPSEHAEWVSGSWRWSGFEWVWLSGGWKVPEIDRAQKRTPTAPVAPPPLQAETHGSAPVAGSVWVAGYWAWTGSWTWVPGRWSMPPQTGATWRPNVWVPEGVTVRLDPGGWILGR